MTDTSGSISYKVSPPEYGDEPIDGQPARGFISAAKPLAGFRRRTTSCSLLKINCGFCSNSSNALPAHQVRCSCCRRVNFAFLRASMPFM